MILDRVMNVCVLADQDLDSDLKKEISKQHHCITFPFNSQSINKIKKEECEILLVKSRFSSIKLKNYLRTISFSKEKLPIILHLEQSNSQDRINYLKIGINECLSGKICCEELMFKLNKLDEYKANKNKLNNGFFYNNFLFCFKSKRAIYNKKEVLLNKKEMLLLECLLKRKNITVPRSLLYLSAWENNEKPTSNSLETHICSLRKKLRKQANLDLIKTVCGIGYVAKTKTPVT
jgi:DNA-binding response OmpR family regulator